MNLVKQIFRPIYAPFVTKYRQQVKLKEQQQKIQTQIQKMQSQEKPIKIIIGAGLTQFEGWITTDIPAFDILKHEHWATLFQPNSIHRMLAEHVFEHLTVEQFRDFLRIARIYLADEGRIRIAIPDGNHIDPNYIQHVRPGGMGDGADDHQVLYTADLITEILTAQGYDFRLLEYFDTEGQFHQQDWDVKDGFIGRSAPYDKRNSNGKLVYTSLILDFWVKSDP